jgi:hypothetical protein
MIPSVAVWEQVECEMCNTRFVAFLLGPGETDGRVDPTGLAVVYADLEEEGSVTCPNPGCQEVFMVTAFGGAWATD